MLGDAHRVPRYAVDKNAPVTDGRPFVSFFAAAFVCRRRRCRPLEEEDRLGLACWPQRRVRLRRRRCREWKDWRRKSLAGGGGQLSAMTTCSTGGDVDDRPRQCPDAATRRRSVEPSASASPRPPRCNWHRLLLLVAASSLASGPACHAFNAKQGKSLVDPSNLPPPPPTQWCAPPLTGADNWAQQVRRWYQVFTGRSGRSQEKFQRERKVSEREIRNGQVIRRPGACVHLRGDAPTRRRKVDESFQ